MSRGVKREVAILNIYLEHAKHQLAWRSNWPPSIESVKRINHHVLEILEIRKRLRRYEPRGAE